MMLHLATKKTITSQTILILKINNYDASNWMVRDFIIVIIAILVLGPKEFPIALKKIGSYIEDRIL